MSALGPEDRALVLRHVAALRRAGTTSAAALTQVVAALPASGLKSSLGEVASALERGQPAGDGNDPMLSVLARGDEATPEVLDQAATAYELAADGRDIATLVVGRLALLLGVTGGILLAFTFLSAAFEELFSNFGGVLPVLTRVMLALRIPFALAGVVAVAAALRVLTRPGPVAAFWEQRLSTGLATQYALLAAVSDAGFDDETSRQSAGLAGPGDGFDALPVEERAAARWVLGTQGFAAAAGFAARSAAARLGARAQLVGLVSDLTLMIWLGLLVGGFIIALYLPIFSLAGSVQ